MRSGAFKSLCHIQIYTVKWTYEPIWESIFSVFWASGVLKSIFPDLSAPKEARETKKIHLKFFIQKGLPPTWETTVAAPRQSLSFEFACTSNLCRTPNPCNTPNQSVTFVKFCIRMNVRIYSYQQNYTNEYPNIFILICLTRTNVRISIRIENCTNIRIYSNIRQGFTL